MAYHLHVFVNNAQEMRGFITGNFGLTLGEQETKEYRLVLNRVNAN